MDKRRLLIFSTQVAGGCFQYSNEIISRWPGKKELVVPEKTAEPHNLKPDWSIKYWGYPAWLRFFSLLHAAIRIAFGLACRKYSGLLLLNTTKWERVILHVWKTSGLPSYVVIHDGVMHDGEKNFRQQQRIVRLMQMSTHTIFLSRYVREKVKNELGVDKPSFLAPHGLIDYGPLPETEKPDRPVLLFFGRVSRYKGVELLLEAIRNVPENLYGKLVIAGEWLYRNTTEYNPDKVTIIDKRLSTEEIKRYLALSDIIVLPYTEATQSGVATLAINYLIPSIATETGAFREQLNDSTTLFIRPDARELAAAITQLLENPQRLDSMKKALEKLRAEYSWEKITLNLANNIEEEEKKRRVRKTTRHGNR